MARQAIAFGGGRRGASRPRPTAARWPFVLVGSLALIGCRPAKSVDFYRAHPIERDSTINRCLAANSNSWDCGNAIAAESERWDAQAKDGFTLVVTEVEAKK